MAARVQRRDDARPTTTAALLRTEVGDEAGTVARLGQAGCVARWAEVVSVLAGRQAKAEELARLVEEGRGARGGQARREGQAGWVKRAKREEVFGSDFKWALAQ
jgi:hypothetical protein